VGAGGGRRRHLAAAHVDHARVGLPAGAEPLGVGPAQLDLAGTGGGLDLGVLVGGMVGRIEEAAGRLLLLGLVGDGPPLQHRLGGIELPRRLVHPVRQRLEMIERGGDGQFVPHRGVGGARLPEVAARPGVRRHGDPVGHLEDLVGRGVELGLQLAPCFLHQGLLVHLVLAGGAPHGEDDQQDEPSEDQQHDEQPGTAATAIAAGPVAGGGAGEAGDEVGQVEGVVAAPVVGVVAGFVELVDGQPVVLGHVPDRLRGQHDVRPVTDAVGEGVGEGGGAAGRLGGEGDEVEPVPGVAALSHECADLAVVDRGPRLHVVAAIGDGARHRVG
jgi:hypothetical protein